jgi:hypothetical protein
MVIKAYLLLALQKLEELLGRQNAVIGCILVEQLMQLGSLPQQSQELQKFLVLGWRMHQSIAQESLI